MNIDTGELKEIKDILKLPNKEKSRYVEIPTGSVYEVKGMNRKQRREWYRANRKKLNLPKWGKEASND